MELLKVSDVLTGGREHNRLAGHRSHRQRRTTAGVTIKLRQDHTGEVHALVEGVSGVHGVLTDHRVDDEQNFVRLNSVTNVACLLHELSVNTQTTRGIDNHHVVQLSASLSHTVTCHLHGIAGGHVKLAGHTGVRRVHGHARALTNDLQLGHRVGALQVGCDQHRGVALALQPVSQLASQGGLTGTLQTRQHDDGRAALRHVDAAGRTAEDAHQLLVHDLDNLLGGIQRLGNFRTKSTFLHVSGKFADHGDGDVSVEQGAADFADGCINVCLGEAALAAQVLKSCRQAVGERIEHEP